MFTAGAFVGAFIGGPLADWLGRRWTMIIGSAIFCVGGALQTAGVHLSHMYSGRLIAGLVVRITEKPLCYAYADIVYLGSASACWSCPWVYIRLSLPTLIFGDGLSPCNNLCWE